MRYHMESWQSRNAGPCKSLIRRCKSGRFLQARVAQRQRQASQKRSRVGSNPSASTTLLYANGRAARFKPAASVRSNRTRSTINKLCSRSPTEEAIGLEPMRCVFESRREYQWKIKQWHGAATSLENWATPGGVRGSGPQSSANMVLLV